GAVINLNTAYMDATDETDFTAGVNALWHRFELGYIYAHNKIDIRVPSTVFETIYYAMRPERFSPVRTQVTDVQTVSFVGMIIDR
ncbi:carbohydrate porin, partial [Salmonella enterica subsp. enterica serovar Virginia]|nr:carbohydrate porin [Salmonella enterica subsp. enterica serovar Virginia]